MNHDAPTVVNVTASAPALLTIEWSTGETLQIDIGEQIECSRKLHPLRDPELFARAVPGQNGDCVTWGNVVRVEACFLFELATQPAAVAAEKRRIRLVGAAELYRSGGALSLELEYTIKNLRMAGGESLPEPVAQLLLDLLYGKAKPRRGAATSAVLIRESFARMYEAWKFKAALDGQSVYTETHQVACFLSGYVPRKPGDAHGSERCANPALARYFAVVQVLAEKWNLSESTISDYIAGRNKRQRSGTKAPKRK